MYNINAFFESFCENEGVNFGCAFLLHNARLAAMCYFCDSFNAIKQMEAGNRKTMLIIEEVKQ